MNTKEFYANRHHPQTAISKANVKLYNEIIDFIEEGRIFEFGCNVGRHIERLVQMGYDCHGVELSIKTVERAIMKDRVVAGDENYLNRIPDNDYDISFTNSVLCHIKNVKDIVEDLKRISSKGVFICECFTKSDLHWWVHDYEAMGFVKVIEIDSALVEKNGARYAIYKYIK